jgi:S1-C subfamily serine protease
LVIDFPFFADPYYNLGIAYDGAGQYAEAIENFIKAEKLYAKSKNAAMAANSRKYARELSELHGYKPEDFLYVVIPSTSKSPSQEKKQILSIATGFIFGSSGYILTNYHVVRGAKSIKIKYQNGEKVKAEVIIKDSQNDIAFLKPKSIPKIRTINLSLADSSSVMLGDKVFTLGYPIANILGENLKYSEGVINSLSGVSDDPKVFQISIPTQHGNSGGPLFNERGEVIGIVSSSLDEAKTQQIMGITPQNVNFAIKSSLVKNMLSMLPENLISPTDLFLVQKKSKGSISNFVQQVENNIVLIKVE